MNIKKIATWSILSTLGLINFIAFQNASTISPSLNGASIFISPTNPLSVSSIIDASLNTWTVSGGVVYVKCSTCTTAVTAGYSANVVLLLYYNNVIYRQVQAGTFLEWNGSTWLTTTDPRVESPSGTAVYGATHFFDAEKNVWLINGGVVYANGTTAGLSFSVIELLFYNNNVYQENSSHQWFVWVYNSTSSNPWTASPDPLSSKSLGINVNWLTYWDSTQAMANAAANSGMKSLTGGYPQVDSKGWPAADFELLVPLSAPGVAMPMQFTGKAIVTSDGAATVSAITYSGNISTATLTPSTSPDGGPHPFAVVSFKSTQRTATAAVGSGITNLTIMRNTSTAKTTIFNPDFLAAVAPFSPIRFMQMQGTGSGVNGLFDVFWNEEDSAAAGVPLWKPNTAYAYGTLVRNNGLTYRALQAGTSGASGGPISNRVANAAFVSAAASITDGTIFWGYAGRSLPVQLGYGNNGISFEEMILFANQTGKAIWINVPMYASTQYITKLAQTFKYGSCYDAAGYLNPCTGTLAGVTPAFPPIKAGIPVNIEWSNETWNSSYFNTRLMENIDVPAQTAAGDPWKIAKDNNANTAANIVRVSLIFRSVVGNSAMMTQYRPIYASQMGYGTACTNPLTPYSQVHGGLNYISTVWGPTSTYATLGPTGATVSNPKQAVGYYIYGIAAANYTGATVGAITKFTATPVAGSSRSFVLDWSTFGAVKVTLNGTVVGKSGSPASGTTAATDITVTPTATTTYTMDVVDASGLTVASQVLTINFGASASNVTSGAPDGALTKLTVTPVAGSTRSFTIDWSTSGATSVTLNGSAVALQGNPASGTSAATDKVVTPTGGTSTYKLTAVNSSGQSFSEIVYIVYGATASTASIATAEPAPAEAVYANDWYSWLNTAGPANYCGTSGGPPSTQAGILLYEEYFNEMAITYGNIKFLLYEGGIDTNNANAVTGSLDLAVLADARAGTATTQLYDNYFNLSQADAGVNFTLIGNGSFGAIQSLTNLNTPIYQALEGVAKAP